MVVKQLLALVHNGHLWIGNQKIAINGELIHRITGLLKEGPDLGIEFVGKHKDTKLLQHMKERFGLMKESEDIKPPQSGTRTFTLPQSSWPAN